MKIIRYKDSADRIGYAWLKPNGTATKITGDIFGQYQITEEAAEVKQLVAPLMPAAIFCIGLNYRKHAEESGAPIPEFPVVFMKNPAAVQHSGGPVEIPTHLRSTQVDYECELAVIIGKRCRNVSREKALDYVFGYTAANDISARDWQGKWGGGQWCRGKTFDTFAPLGPVIVTAAGIVNPNALRIRTILNGEVMQDSNTADMIFDVPRIIEFLSGSTTLLPGTVILTGTPQGIGAARKPPRFLQPGDEIAVEIEKIGLLTNPVVEEKVQSV
jgi:2-keto-4-pentenoate hydratase/2-oxohepta-3-ene-1,7-dioic acid hydratase in catechol pathway